MDQLKNIGKYFILGINLVVLILLIISAYSDRVSSEKSVFFSYMGMIFPFIFIACLTLTVIWLAFRQWKYALILAVGIIVCWGAASTYFPVHVKTKELPQDCIKLLTYNVMKFEHEKAHKKNNPNRILQYIIDSKADVVCLQEYAFIESGERLKDQDIKNALKGYRYSRTLKLSNGYGNEFFGLAIYSKFPILSFKEIPFESHYNGSFIAELDIKGKRTTLINNHLESNKLSLDERTEYYDLTKEFDSDKLEVVTSRVTKRLTPAFKIRAKQADIVSKYIKENENPYIIVCGDFNDTPISYSRHQIKGDLKDAFVSTGSGLGISYNRHRFLFRIDYIFHSKNIKAYNCSVDNSIKNSDHYPVSTYLEFK